ncbi:hypothetical protein COY32_00500 [candidate division WWE3 bacterium CG_4_10_14_0_2_um_filter_41_14]|uniref:FCP1 homology domain-containing protein n=1 Tax=candidate division WWE3 bacterium CG_4_10_14_0_2_um_filter_41_14 TaxID=1975072 RepID=A0A2M7TLV3_UNCKA|nr:MAG: hypothetical protein COY32_00500 [candidate division WWE3 bacterium CG_4_10_14_0_2_um_filter_41_14]
MKGVIMSRNIENTERTSRQRIAVDLDGTLIFNPNPFETETPSLRTGATRLLEGLKNTGSEVVLYTSASREWVDYVFRLFPQMESLFENVFCKENTPAERRSRGIKDPAIIGADIFIDNYIDSSIQAKLGSRAIQVAGVGFSDSESDQWAIDTLDKVNEVLGR